jgi:hypothetical protein
MWYMVSDIKGRTQTEGVWEQGPGESIWMEVRWGDMSVEKTV